MTRFVLKALLSLLMLCSVQGFALLDKGVSLLIEPLFWNATQPGMDYAFILLQSGSNPSTIGVLRSVNQKDGWIWGFRASAGIDLNADMDGWISWTSFHDHIGTRNAELGLVGNQIIGANPANIIDFPSGGFGRGGPALSRWSIALDLLDLDLLFSLFEGPYYEIHPYLGVKGGWIHQEQEITYINFIGQGSPGPVYNATIHQFNRFWGAGPKGGCAGSYDLTGGLRFVGGVSGALLVGQLNSPLTNFVTIDGAPSSMEADHSTHRLIPTMQLFVGLDWEILWSGCETILGLGYELHYFWNTWRLQNAIIGSQFITTSGFSSLMFQGVTTRFGICF